LVAALAIAVRAGAPTNRPDLLAAKPVASCKLQSLGDAQSSAPMRVVSNVYSVSTPIEDPLANYERAELGGWRMPADAAMSDPWMRLLLLSPKRPYVVDIAVFVEGKSYRESREAWIDGLLAAGASAPASDKAAEPEAKIDEADAKKVTSEAKGEPAEEEVATADAKQASPADKKADEKVPGIATQTRGSLSMRDRLTNYVAASGANVDREEIRWLIAEWGSGPGVVVLGPALSWQRVGMATLEALLDTDADGTLAAAEIAAVDTVVQSADTDANDVVEVSEMRRAAKREMHISYEIGHSLVVMIDANTDWDALAATVRHVYARNANASPSTAPAITAVVERIARGDASLQGEDLRVLTEAAADVSLRVDFSSASPSEGTVSLVAVSQEIGDEKDFVSNSENAISVKLGADCLEISAAGAPGQQSGGGQSQIAVGAVIDGNPLLRLLDRDQDQRLTTRERQELRGLSASLDRDADGALDAAEVPVPMRLGITLGPHVHTLLAKPTGAVRAVAPRDKAVLPDWFASMDKNADRDLSRDEFLGTTEQFKQIDTNTDGLMSVAEALKLKSDQ
jgi:hypothetical protein